MYCFTFLLHRHHMSVFTFADNSNFIPLLPISFHCYFKIMLPKNKCIPNRLWLHRKRMGYTQKEVAKQLGLRSTSIISRWEKGEALPSCINLLKLSLLYKTLVNDFYRDLSKDLAKELFPKE